MDDRRPGRHPGDCRSRGRGRRSHGGRGGHHHGTHHQNGYRRTTDAHHGHYSDHGHDSDHGHRSGGGHSRARRRCRRCRCRTHGAQDDHHHGTHHQNGYRRTTDAHHGHRSGRGHRSGGGRNPARRHCRRCRCRSHGAQDDHHHGTHHQNGYRHMTDARPGHYSDHGHYWGGARSRARRRCHRYRSHGARDGHRHGTRRRCGWRRTTAGLPGWRR